MNYSKNANNRKKEIRKTILISWAIFLLIGILIGALISTSIAAINIDAEPENPLPAITPTITTTPMVTVKPVSTCEPNETNTPTEPENSVICLGKYKLTAYCPCEKCCGVWGKNRPLDDEGNVIVITASGERAKEGVTVAADISVLPFGTVILIDGNEYIVQDRGGSVKGNQIDIYFESHQEALEFGVQYKEIYTIEREVEKDD